MKESFSSLLRASAVMLVMFTLILGIAYPLAATLLLQTAFPRAAHGSLIERDGKIVGSELLGQEFTSPRYFWSRPSATTPPYNAAASGGSNLSPANKALKEAVQARSTALRQNGENSDPVPVDLVTSSASGLDPDISLAGAFYQAPRVARARHLRESDVRALIDAQLQDRQFLVLGEPRVNVLKLNLALDAMEASQLLPQKKAVRK